MTTYHAINNKPEPIALDKASAPDWAKGCEKCKYGVIAHVDYNHAPLPLYLLQPVLASVYLIEFCDCQAGQVASNYARGMYKRLRDGGVLDAETAKIKAWVEDAPTVHAEAA